MGSSIRLGLIMMYKKESIDYFNNLMGDIVSKDLRTFLTSSGFFTSPASAKYHGSFRGGLLIHSIEVVDKLLEMTSKMGLVWSREQSPYIIGMFHDLCKMDNYITSKDGQGYSYNESKLLEGHGEKSVMLLSTFMTLTEEEMLCIRYHMGAYVKEDWKGYDLAIKKYPNVLWTHTADMYASKVVGT